MVLVSHFFSSHSLCWCDERCVMSHFLPPLPLSSSLFTSHFHSYRCVCCCCCVGTIYYRQERFELAEYHFKRAIEINPNSSVLRCHLGLVLNAHNRYGPHAHTHQHTPTQLTSFSALSLFCWWAKRCVACCVVCAAVAVLLLPLPCWTIHCRSEKTLESIDLLRQACSKDVKNPQVPLLTLSSPLSCHLLTSPLLPASFPICSCPLHQWLQPMPH
jgi:tetratricopeptide (TPR) repeat protein